MTTLVRDPGLRAYASLLMQAGFQVYAPGPTWDFLHYSRELNGQTLVGYIQLDRYSTLERALGNDAPYAHSMPLVPSRAYGSSMFVTAADKLPPLSVEAALAVTQPTNWNDVVGTQRNAGTAKDFSHHTLLNPEDIA
jgi:hypothetical protein